MTLATAAAGALALHAPAAYAQARTANPAFSPSNGPIDITADSLDVIDGENKAIWRGNVEAIQGMDRLRTPELTVFFAKSSGGGQGAAGLGGGFGQIQRMEAQGPVYYVTPSQNARGDHAVYEAGPHQITMTGNVVLVQDKNVVQGDRLVIDTTNNHSQLFSNNQSRGQKRVRGVFYPGQSQPAGADAPAANPPAARP